jgi:hypothetical protein
MKDYFYLPFFLLIILWVSLKGYSNDIFGFVLGFINHIRRFSRFSCNPFVHAFGWKVWTVQCTVYNSTNSSVSLFRKSLRARKSLKFLFKTGCGWRYKVSRLWWNLLRLSKFSSCIPGRRKNCERLDNKSKK